MANGTDRLGRVDTKIKRRFLSRISAQTRRENAGGLSPGKFSRRSMRKILPKRCVLGLVSTRPKPIIGIGSTSGRQPQYWQGCLNAGRA